MKRTVSLIAAAALLFGFFGLFALPAAAAGSTAGYAAEVAALVNAERAKAGLGPLGSLDSLSAAAKKRAGELVRLYSHTRPGGRGCFTVLDDYGIEISAGAENIAVGQDTPAEVMQAWMKSAGHKKNILGNYDRLGVGVHVKNGKIYWVQLFIRDKTASGGAAWRRWPPVAQWLARVFLFGWIWMR